MHAIDFLESVSVVGSFLDILAENQFRLVYWDPSSDLMLNEREWVWFSSPFILLFRFGVFYLLLPIKSPLFLSYRWIQLGFNKRISALWLLYFLKYVVMRIWYEHVVATWMLLWSVLLMIWGFIYIHEGFVPRCHVYKFIFYHCFLMDGHECTSIYKYDHFPYQFLLIPFASWIHIICEEDHLLKHIWPSSS